MIKLKPADLLIIALNLVPLVGAYAFGWKSFDLIFLYWMENVVIGAFTVLRMIVRPYQHVVDVSPLAFLVPFFVLHYGLFCFGHGTFVLKLFGGDGRSSGGLFEQTLLILDEPGMKLALLSLIALQVFDWLSDTAKKGLGGDGVKELMTAPYRRILVLHFVILGGGFALTALGEPAIGLLALFVIKTISDIYHERKISNEAPDEAIDLTEEQIAEMNEQFAEPVVTINGKEKRYASFAELKRSKEFRMMKSVMRLMGGGDRLRIIERFIDQKIAEEQVEGRAGQFRA